MAQSHTSLPLPLLRLPGRMPEMGDSRSAASIDGLAWSPDGQVVSARCAQGIGAVLPVTPQTLAAALWNATRDCLSIEHRCKLLFESREQAARADALTRQELSRRWSAAPSPGDGGRAS